MSSDYEKRISEKVARTTKISDLTRYISFGLVALTYSIFTSKSEFAVLLLENFKSLFLYASLSGFIAIFFDYLQYLFGYISVNKALKESDHQYDNEWCSYRLIKLLFVGKQLFVLIGVFLVCVAMFTSAVA